MRDLGVADPGSDEPWEWWTLGVANHNHLIYYLVYNVHVNTCHAVHNVSFKRMKTLVMLQKPEVILAYQGRTGTENRPGQFVTSTLPAQPWQNPKNRLFSTQKTFYHFNHAGVV